jgi:Kef-type K+ transport system membrane component KefB
LPAEYFGFHRAIGTYIAGLIIKREYFDYHRERNIDFYRQARDMINNIALAWIGPAFFVSLGTVLVLDTRPADWLGRAELAFVVLDIAYVQYQIISLKASDCLMLTACLLDLPVPLCTY